MHPVVTPRFVPSCTPALLQGLGRIAQRSACHVQSHISESLDNDAFVAQLHPEVTLGRQAHVQFRHPLPCCSCGNAWRSSRADPRKANSMGPNSPAAASGCADLQDLWSLQTMLAMASGLLGCPCSHAGSLSQVGGGDAQLYERAGLLTQRTVMVHGVTLTDAELQLLAERGTALAHCPLSNFYFADIPLDVLRCLAAGVKVRGLLTTSPEDSCRACQALVAVTRMPGLSASFCTRHSILSPELTIR